MEAVKFSPLNRNYWYRIVDDGLELWMKDFKGQSQIICMAPKYSLDIIEERNLNCSESLREEICSNFLEDVKVLLSRANPKLIERLPVWIFADPDNIKKAYEGLERYYVKEAKYMVSQGYENNTIITYLFLTKEHCINKIKKKVDILIKKYQKEAAKLVLVELECYKKSWVKNYYPAKYFKGSFQLLINERSKERSLEAMLKDNIPLLDDFQEENLQKIRAYNAVEKREKGKSSIKIIEDEE